MLPMMGGGRSMQHAPVPSQLRLCMHRRQDQGPLALTFLQNVDVAHVNVGVGGTLGIGCNLSPTAAMG